MNTQQHTAISVLERHRLLEAVVVPLAVDGRPSRACQTWLETCLVRLTGPTATPLTAVITTDAVPAAVDPSSISEAPVDRLVEVGPVIPMDDGLVPQNRAERREQQREQAQAKRKRPVRTAAPATP